MRAVIALCLVALVAGSYTELFNEDPGRHFGKSGACRTGPDGVNHDKPDKPITRDVEPMHYWCKKNNNKNSVSQKECSDACDAAGEACNGYMWMSKNRHQCRILGNTGRDDSRRGFGGDNEFAGIKNWGNPGVKCQRGGHFGVGSHATHVVGDGGRYRWKCFQKDGHKVYGPGDGPVLGYGQDMVETQCSVPCCEGTWIKSTKTCDRDDTHTAAFQVFHDAASVHGHGHSHHRCYHDEHHPNGCVCLCDDEIIHFNVTKITSPPSEYPTAAPTANPTASPTAVPTASPTAHPTIEPHTVLVPSNCKGLDMAKGLTQKELDGPCNTEVKLGAVFKDTGAKCGVNYGPHSIFGNTEDYIDHSKEVRIEGDIVNTNQRGSYVVTYSCDPQDSEGHIYEHKEVTRTVYVGMSAPPAEKWCKYTSNGDETWDWRENRNAGDIHAKRMAKGKNGEEKCRKECNSMGSEACYAFVYHKFGNCKFITRKSFADQRRIMGSGKGTLYHHC